MTNRSTSGHLSWCVCVYARGQGQRTYHPETLGPSLALRRNLGVFIVSVPFSTEPPPTRALALSVTQAPPPGAVALWRVLAATSSGLPGTG